MGNSMMKRIFGRSEISFLAVSALGGGIGGLVHGGGEAGIAQIRRRLANIIGGDHILAEIEDYFDFNSPTENDFSRNFQFILGVAPAGFSIHGRLAPVEGT